MANYVKTTDFAAKDALASGNPNKIASGTQVDTEFNNIATAIGTKEDTANKGINNGYASLDSSGDVPDGQIPSTIPRLSSANVFTSTVELQTTSPTLILDETDATANARTWLLRSGGGSFALSTATDAAPTTSVSNAILVDRTGTTVNSIAFTATAVTVNGTSVNNASILTAGTLADARVAASNVTQHQAALTIAETQISDGSVYPRISGTETISGTWTFSNSPTVVGTAPNLYWDESDAAANNQTWSWTASGEQFMGKAWNDALSTSGNWVVVDRTLNVIDSIALTSTALTWNGNTLFTTANDGTGSGLDADLLDGNHATAFATASHNHSATEITSGTLAVARGGTGVTTSTGTGNVVLSASPTLSGTITGGTFSGTFSGTGSSITALNATQLTSGSVPDARIPSSNVTQHGLALILSVSTIQADPGGTPSGSPGQLFLYY